MLIEFAGRPGTGKSTLSHRIADDLHAVLLRIDRIEAALWRNALTPDQTGIAAYSVAHDLATDHLRRGLIVVVDAVSPVEEARAGWRELAAATGVRHVVVETVVPDADEHERRVRERASDIPGFEVPTWTDVSAREYRPRTDPRLVLDTTKPVADCLAAIRLFLARVN
jgi:predicted kinase